MQSLNALRALLLSVACAATPPAHADITDLKFTNTSVAIAPAGWFDVGVVNGPGKLVSVEGIVNCNCSMMFGVWVDGKFIELDMMGPFFDGAGILPNEPLQRQAANSSGRIFFSLPEALKFNTEVKLRMRISGQPDPSPGTSAHARIVTAAP
jgi:hypothetical protein